MTAGYRWIIATTALFTAIGCPPAGGGDDAGNDTGDSTGNETGGATGGETGHDTPPDSDVARMCLMNNVCGFQNDLGLQADLCTDRVLDMASANVIVRSPEELLRDARMIECAGTATTCDEYVSCVRFGESCSGTVEGSCQGTIANRCSTPGDNYLPPIFDCALVGMTCEVLSSAICVLPASAPECADPSAVTCDGDARVFCRPRTGGGFGEFHDPCPVGTTCQLDGSNVYCGPPTASCAAESAACEGDVAVYCFDEGAGLQEIRYDCAAVGRKCAPDGGEGYAACVPTATECTAPSDGTSTATCDGDALEVCIEGELHHVECPSVGRATCSTVPEIPGAQAATVACF